MCGAFASLVKGDSPLCGEMWRSDRGDGHRFGEGPPQVAEGLTRTTHIAPHFLFFHFWLGYAKFWRCGKNFSNFPTLPIDIVGIMVYS